VKLGQDQIRIADVLQDLKGEDGVKSVIAERKGTRITCCISRPVSLPPPDIY
jgi:hypothetical protein